ncbi:MAG: winged helix-turn-helix domain-containing protein [Nitrososphaerales archaeon]
MSSERPRSALKIYLDILITVRDEGNTKPTRILYKANLSHDRLVKYLGELTTKGLLDERQDEDSKFYTLTQKGLDFINQIKKAEAFVMGFGLAI